MRQSHSNGTTWLVLLVLGGIGCGKEENDLLAAIENRGVLRMASDPAYPPQSSLEDGVWKGFDISVGEEIARRIGVKLEPMPSDWQEVTSGNWGERWDISVGSMTDTLTRESVLYFAKPPYYYTPAVFGASPQAGVSTLADLAGETVCTCAECSYEAWLDRTLDIPTNRIFQQPPANMTVVTETVESLCIDAIASGTKDYQIAIASESVIDFAVRENKLVRIDPPVFVEDLCVAVTRSHLLDPTRLVEKIGRIVEEIHKDGTLRTLSLEWFDKDLTQAPSGL